MKFKLIALYATLLLITGCTAKEYREYDNLCENLPKGFLNEDLQEAYNKEKGVYIETNDDLDWLYTSLPRKNNRWEFVEVYLNQDLGYGFPKEDGLFRIYRDYNFNNCIEYVSFDNKHTDIDGDFCLAFNKIEKPSANLRLVKKRTEINTNARLIEFNLYVKDEIFLKTNAGSFSSDSGTYGCRGDYYNNYAKDFR